LYVRFNKLGRVLKMLNHKNKDDPPFTLHEGFLKWKIKTDYYGTKLIVEKIALN